MNELPKPLEETDVAITIHIRLITQGEHLAVKRLVIGKQSCKDHGYDAEYLLFLKNGDVMATPSKR
jgi:hypothetical protein